MFILYDESSGGRGMINLPEWESWKIHVQKNVVCNGQKYSDYRIILTCGEQKTEILDLNFLWEFIEIPWFEIMSFANAIIEEFVRLMSTDEDTINVNQVVNIVLENEGFRSAWIKEGHITKDTVLWE